MQAFDDDPSKDADKLEQLLKGLRDDADKALADQKLAEGALDSLAAAGLFTELTLAEEEHARIMAELEQEKLRCDAIRLLHELFTRLRAEATSAVIQPVQNRATGIFKRIAGDRPGQIQLNASFVPSGVSTQASDTEVNIENISTGEEEQVYLSVRLAFANIIAEKERQLVVLDDIMTATDTGRMARIIKILEEASEKLQLLILACHPERYRALADAQFFDLEGIVARSGA